MAIEPSFPDPVPLGPRRGTRDYKRRAAELVLAPAVVEDAASGAALDGLILDPASELVYAVENHPWFEAFSGAGFRWVRCTAGDDDLPLRAAALEARDEVGWASPVYQPADGGDDEAATPVPGDILVRIAPGHAAQAIAEIEARGFVHLVEISDLLGDERHLFRLADGQPRWAGLVLVEEVRHQIRGVMFAEHDWMLMRTFQAFPDDPDFKEQLSLKAIDVLGAWQALGESRQVKGPPWPTQGEPVVVIDTGFDLSHPDIAFDADTGRHLDVQALWQTDNLATSHAVGTSAYPHGTQVAGLVGAVANNALGIAGVAGACGVVPVRVGASATAGHVAAAIGWARTLTESDDRIRVVNLSLATVETDTLTTRIALAARDGMVLCAASGNLPYGVGAGSVNFPGRHPDVIAVGASDGDKGRKEAGGYGDWQSRYGPGLDVVAPSAGIVTTLDGGGYGSFGGTSAATPHVAGVAALVLAKEPDLSRQQVRNVIQRTCIEIGPYVYGPNPELINGPAWTPEVGCGLINAGAALRLDHAAMHAPAPLPVPEQDPCDPTDLVSYVGIPGRAPGAGTLWRIYSSESLTSWIEVDEDDIVEVEDLAVAFRFRVLRGAPIRRAWSEALTAGQEPPTG